MVEEYILKYLQDVLDAINELEGFFTDFPRRYDLFEKDRLRICAVERKTENNGGSNQPYKEERPYICIPNAKEIINTRNRIIHGYDSVETEFLWGLVVRHIPELKKDIEQIIRQYEERYNHENNIDSDKQ